MHPMFVELFIKPDEALEDDGQRRVRRPRQLRTVSVARGRSGGSRASRAGRRTS
jgi:hypothetical protein